MPTRSNNIILRPSQERGFADHGWLKSRHTFSFADYHDPDHTGFGTLRVINEDRIAGGTGFGAHPHRDMEIVSYVVEGGLEHTDSMGNKAVILPDEVQIMSAGRGVTHAEMNHFKDRETHFFQIWILPREKGIAPSYGQKSFKDAFTRSKLVLAVSPDHREGSIGINQDADIYIGRFKAGDALNFPLRQGRKAWVQMVKGRAEINAQPVQEGDGAAVSDEKQLSIATRQGAELILFDLG